MHRYLTNYVSISEAMKDMKHKKSHVSLLKFSDNKAYD